jgi:predicted nucleic acid-binding protein
MTIRSITLDTGALVAIERRKQRGAQLLQLAKQRLAVLAVPMPVIAEWWRGRTDVRERVLDVVNVEPLSLSVAKAAGEAQAAVRSSTAIDAIVMAFAASRGDVVPRPAKFRFTVNRHRYQAGVPSSQIPSG